MIALKIKCLRFLPKKLQSSAVTIGLQNKMSNFLIKKSHSDPMFSTNLVNLTSLFCLIFAFLDKILC